MAQYDLNLRDYWRIVRRHKFYIVLFPCILGVMSYAFAEVNKPIPLYQARATVKFEEATPMSRIMFDYYRPQRKNLAAQAMAATSFPVLARAAARMHKIPAESTVEQIRENPELLDVVLSMGDLIETTADTSLGTIDIAVTSQNPKEAQSLANLVAEAFREQNIKENNRQATDTRSFIERQLKVTEEKLRAAEETLRNYKESEKLLAIDNQVNLDLNQLARLKAELVEARAEKAETKSLLKTFNEAEGEGVGRVLSEGRNPSLHNLGKNLSDLELKYRHLKRTYTDDHPMVSTISSQIRDVRKQIERELEAQQRVVSRREQHYQEQIRQHEKTNDEMPGKAVQLARLQREVKLNEEMYGLLNTKLQEARIEEAGTVSEVSVVKLATLPIFPINRVKVVQKTAVGIVIGLIMGLVFAFIRETFDLSSSTPEDIESHLETPVLGVIPRIDLEEVRGRFLAKVGDEKHIEDEILIRLVTHFADKCRAAECYRTLRTHLLSIRKENRKKTFVITSCLPMEGKTTASINLAITLAQSGLKTLLVEADMRTPKLERIFGLHDTPGLSEYLLGAKDQEEVVHDVVDFLVGSLGFENVIITPGMDNLQLVHGGQVPSNPSELLNSERMRDFLEKAKASFDLVIVDTPPVLLVADPNVLASQVDGVLLVYKVSKTSRHAATRAKLSLETVNAVVEGLVINGVVHDKTLYETYYGLQPGISKAKKGKQRHVTEGS